MIIKPNFCEAQLQQTVNTAITMRLYESSRRMHHPIIPSLHQEALLGWDSGFIFDGLDYPIHRLPTDRGCNFFIQYKLSELVTNKNTIRSMWNDSNYLQFHIYYQPRPSQPNGFAQFENLRQLANHGYFVYYITNHVTDETELFGLADSQILLDEIPCLDVAEISRKHKKVTFTKGSSYFLLHSKPEEVKQTKWNDIYKLIRSKTINGSTLQEDLKILIDFILHFEKSINLKTSQFQRNIHKINEQLSPSNLRLFYKAHLVSNYLKLYFNLNWYRIEFY